MADPYYSRYGTPPDPASIPRSSFAGYMPSEAPSLASPHVSSLTDFQGIGSDYLHGDTNSFHTGSYGIDNGVGDHTKGYASHEYSDLIRKKRDLSQGISPGDPDITNGRSALKSTYNALPNSAGDSNIIFVGGLPSDCTRREVGHLFRPFIGYKDIRVVHKEPRRSGDKASVLCFVEFTDSKCALTAMEALQGYKFDDKKPESQTLRIQFVHFPFRPPPDQDN
ncbi:RNA-binding protein 1-like [Prosopis cineraria]|uniref:RNA-binding protein 1-like n=1 Tax=Prosopis cineraria TaxID=364024 RepID=UPI00241048DC|nr:RNA-binding protein 1-like [Prosopis cineraria]